MDFFFVEYRDPIFGLLVLVALVLVVALAHYAWRNIARKHQKKGLEGFIKKFEIADEHKELLRTQALSLENLRFLAGIFSKSGEFEKAIQIYLIALERARGKGREAVFYDLAEVYFRAGFLQKSEEVLLNALSLRPRNEKALKLLKIVYLRLKKYDEVLQTLDCLFELGFEVAQEREFVEFLANKSAENSGFKASANLDENLANSSEFGAENSENSANLAENSQSSLTKNGATHAKKDGEAKNSAQIQSNDFVKRYLLEKEGTSCHAEFGKVVDLLYKAQTPIFLEDSEYFELFCAKKLAAKRENYAFKNKKLKMLEILNDNDFAAKLSFSYVCAHCKNQMPLFFYHCPLCYEFGGCKILYEVGAVE